MIYFDQDFINFFKELENNNSKIWFDKNRKRYFVAVKEPMERFVNDLIEAYRVFDTKIDITYKQAIFRINRDVRFSKDKKPYKVHVGAVICSGGKKNMIDPCMYVEIDSQEVRLFSGLYMIDKDRLQKLREFIAANLKKFKRLLEDKNFKKKFGKILGEKNKRLPKELQAAAEKQPLIYNKNYYYFVSYPVDFILKNGLIEKLIEDYEVAIKMNEFIKQGIGR